MKALLTIISLVSVLGGTSIANAAAPGTQTLPISQVLYQEGSWEITVIGRLSNGCLSSPRPFLVPSPGKRNTFDLQVVAVKTGEMCAMVVSGPFAEKADLRALVQKTGIAISADQEYTVVANGTTFSVTFKGSDVLAYKVQSKVEGTLLSARTGQLALVTAEQRMVLIDDSLVNAHAYINQQVIVTGHLAHVSRDPRQISPMVRLQPSLPLQRLVVTSIAAVE